MESFRFLMVTTHFPPFHIGGDAIMVEYLSRELLARGHEVRVVASPSVYRTLKGNKQEGHAQDDFLDIVVESRNSRLPRLDVFWAYTMGESGNGRKVLEDACKSFKPDIVHWHNTKAFLGRPHAVPGASTLVTAHDYFAICPRTNLLEPGRRPCQEPRLCQLCLVRWRRPPQLWRVASRRVIKMPEGTKVLCPSGFMADRLAREGIESTHVLRNFVPDLGMAALPQASDARTVTYIGIMEPHKGPETLLRAFNASKNNHRFHLYMIGDGSQRSRLVGLVKEMELEGRVSVTGHLKREEMHRILAGSSLLVVPSEWFENAPLTALEGLSLGVPVLGSRIGGLPEILTLDSGCDTFEAGNVDELAVKLVEKWNDGRAENDWRKMARRAYESRYSPDAHIKEYLRILHT